MWLSQREENSNETGGKTLSNSGLISINGKEFSHEDKEHYIEGLKIGEIMYYNWNRMALLERREKKTDLEEKEVSMRLHFQNAFACTKDDEKGEEDRIKVATTVKKTLSKQVIKSVDSFMRGK